MNIDLTGIDQSTLPLKISSLKTLIDMALSAGKAALDMRAEVDISTKSGPEDLVTCADKKLSEILMEGLTREFPDDHVISEEHPFEECLNGARRWFVDPIDGTKHYVQETGRWSVMLGLVDENQPIFGVVYIPARQTLYFGGPACGSWCIKEGGELARLSVPALSDSGSVKTLISKNDLSKNLWAADIAGIKIETASSIGLDVHEVLQSNVDAFVHIRPTLKTWDTAAPAAIALGAGLEIGTENGKGFFYPHDHARHESHIVIGRIGSLGWWKSSFEKYGSPAAGGSMKSMAGCC